MPVAVVATAPFVLAYTTTDFARSVGWHHPDILGLLVGIGAFVVCLLVIWPGSARRYRTRDAAAAPTIPAPSGESTMREEPQG